MLQKITQMTGLMSVVLALGLIITGVAAFGGNNYGSMSENSGLLEDTFVRILAEKVGVDEENLEAMMDEAMSGASSGDDRPIADSYLKILASDLGLDVDQLRSIMVTTKGEAIEELVSEGKISEELAGSWRDRATTFPFGYSYQGSKTESDQVKSGNREVQYDRGYGSSGQNGKRLQPRDGSSFGPGTCDGEGPHGRVNSDDRGGGGSGGRERGN